MKKTILTIVALIALVSMNAQEKTLLTIDGEQISQKEFLYIYEKNNQETTIDKKSVDEYLDLFINFRLKVHEAELQGIDTTKAFIKELDGYRAQAISKYMVYQAGEDSMAMVTYNHMAKERRAAHIAVKCPSNADSATVAEAMAKINAARERVTGTTKQVKKGKKMVTIVTPKEDFFTVCKEVSDDPGLAESGGELGWITTFRYVWPLEKAVYDTEVGGVSEVFRSGFGFHIALVEEERDREEISASHIMKMVPRGNDEVALTAKHAIDSLYLLVQNGADFAELAKANSDDRGSAGRGGDLGWFTRGQMVAPFENAAFALKNEGDISEPIFSNYGWHIIKFQGRRGILPFAEVQEEIVKKMARDERHKEVQVAQIKHIRNEYNLPAEMSDKDVLAVEESHLEEKYEDLRYLMKEYHDGNLLFDISLKNVWDKASQDTAGLEGYFARHKKEFTWDAPKYKGFVFYCKDKATAKAVKAIAKSANPDSISSYINQRLNTDSVKCVVIEKGLWAKGGNKAVDKLQWKSGDFAPKAEYPVVFLHGKVLKAPEAYTDERGKVINGYQDELEQEWVNQLRSKYSVEVNQEALEEIKANLIKK